MEKQNNQELEIEIENALKEATDKINAYYKKMKKLKETRKLILRRPNSKSNSPYVKTPNSDQVTNTPEAISPAPFSPDSSDPEKTKRNSNRIGRHSKRAHRLTVDLLRSAIGEEDKKN